MADALPMPVLKQRQTQVEAELADARRLVQSAQTDSKEAKDRLEQVLTLLEHAPALYTAVGPNERALLNRAAFKTFDVDAKPDERYLRTQVAHSTFSSAVDAVLQARTSQTPKGTLDRVQSVEGSNVIHLAEVARFELARGLNLNPLSRRAH